MSSFDFLITLNGSLTIWYEVLSKNFVYSLRNIFKRHLALREDWTTKNTAVSLRLVCQVFAVIPAVPLSVRRKYLIFQGWVEDQVEYPWIGSMHDGPHTVEYSIWPWRLCGVGMYWRLCGLGMYRRLCSLGMDRRLCGLGIDSINCRFDFWCRQRCWLFLSFPGWILREAGVKLFTCWSPKNAKRKFTLEDELRIGVFSCMLPRSICFIGCIYITV